MLRSESSARIAATAPRRPTPRAAHAIAALLLLASCKASGVPTDAKTTVLSFPDLDCSDCGEMLARSVIQHDGVYKTAFDKHRVELTVVAAPSIDALMLAKSAKPADEDWHLVAGAGQGRYLPWAPPPAGADVIQLSSDGTDVPDLAAHLAIGKVTIVDFSAKWCEPCRDLDAHVTEIIVQRSDVAYRKIDVGDWDTPIAARYLEGVKELPYVMFFDKKGQPVETMTGLDLPRFDRLLAAAAAR